MKGFRILAGIDLVRGIISIVLLLSFNSPAPGKKPSLGRDSSIDCGYRISPLATPIQPAPATASECDTAGKNEISIACNYAEPPVPGAIGNAEPVIVLNRTVLSFKTNEENFMRVELTFTNRGGIRVSDARSVYLEIDDNSGRNYLRRVVPGVDFRKLAPGKRLTFSDKLLIAVLPPGHYAVQLWIPNPDPSRKFNPAYNFLLSNPRVPNKRTGLNTLATFEIVHRCKGLH